MSLFNRDLSSAQTGIYVYGFTRSNQFGPVVWSADEYRPDPRTSEMASLLAESPAAQIFACADKCASNSGDTLLLRFPIDTVETCSGRGGLSIVAAAETPLGATDQLKLWLMGRVIQSLIDTPLRGLADVERTAPSTMTDIGDELQHYGTESLNQLKPGYKALAAWTDMLVQGQSMALPTQNWTLESALMMAALQSQAQSRKAQVALTMPVSQLPTSNLIAYGCWSDQIICTTPV